MSPATETIPSQDAVAPRSLRIASIDATRGFVMFTMIFVNDLAGVSPKIVPAWMRHFHGRSGMTFVDQVFPAFLFLVGMSIPLAIDSRLAKGHPWWRVLAHVFGRALALLLIGILMVNDESADSTALGWSSALWSVLMFISAILAFSSISTKSPSRCVRIGGIVTRVLGFLGLLFLALVFRGKGGQRVITLSPFSINTHWYGILGLIGWAYLVGAVIYMIFRDRKTALLGCVALLLCLYVADKTGRFNGFWLGRYVGIDTTIGSQPSVTVAGILLAAILLNPSLSSWNRRRSAIAFALAFAAAAWLLVGTYGVNKNAATPSWCLWSCAITAALWTLMDLLCETAPATVARTLATAGQNVIFAYLLSEMFPSLLELLGWDNWYDRLAEPNLFHAIARSALCGVLILAATTALNRAGFRVKL